MRAGEGGTPPVLVETLRGDVVESRHRGSFAVVDATGRVVASAGDIAAPVFPRSAVKPLQALPLVESGAADALALSDREIALACASHRGEPAHVDAVRAWLAAAKLGPSDLECGAHAPANEAAAAALIRQGLPPSPLHNNCSGKHAGFLCTAAHLGEDTRGYVGRDHPVQRRVADALADMTGADVAAAPCGHDGCGIPAFALPLRAIARGMARMVDTAGLGPARARAAGTILTAMAAEPFFVEGTNRFVSTCLAVAGDSVRVKVGAEGFYAAALPRLGYGIALKIEDGATRAAELATASLLRSLGCFDAGQERALATFLAPVILDVAGVPVGALRPTSAASFARP